MTPETAEAIGRLKATLVTPEPDPQVVKRVRLRVEVPAPDLRAALTEIDRLQAELDRERMRLAACGVVALADTPESAAKARDMHPDYRSASCDDVARRVDECMSLRADAQKWRDLQTPRGIESISVALCGCSVYVRSDGQRSEFKCEGHRG